MALKTMIKVTSSKQEFKIEINVYQVNYTNVSRLLREGSSSFRIPGARDLRDYIRRSNLTCFVFRYCFIFTQCDGWMFAESDDVSENTFSSTNS